MSETVQEITNDPARVGLAVIGQAMLDIELDPSQRSSTDRRRTSKFARATREDGLAWVLDDTSDEGGFSFWCGTIRQEPRIMRAQILARLAKLNTEWSWRAVKRIAEKL